MANLFPIPLPAVIPADPPARPAAMALAILGILVSDPDQGPPDYVLVARPDGWIEVVPMTRVRLVGTGPAWRAIEEARAAIDAGDVR